MLVTPSKSGVQNALHGRSRALNKAVAKGVYEEPGDRAHVAVVLLIEGAEVADWIIFHDIFVSFRRTRPSPAFSDWRVWPRRPRGTARRGRVASTLLQYRSLDRTGPEEVTSAPAVVTRRREMTMSL